MQAEELLGVMVFIESKKPHPKERTRELASAWGGAAEETLSVRRRWSVMRMKGVLEWRPSNLG